MSGPTIVVCMKQVPDPEVPASSFEIDPEAKRVVPVGVPPVINPFDENALEAALRIKDEVGGRVLAVSLVERPAMAVLRKALSVGAEELFLLQGEGLEELDGYCTAVVLAAALKRIGTYDLILTGRQSSDWGSAQVGPMLAELLGIPSIGFAQEVRVQDRMVLVKRLRRIGYEVVRAPLPALITASSEIGDLRLPSLQAIREAAKKPVTVWGMEDLGLRPEDLRPRELHRLAPPPPRQRRCLFIDGDTPEERGERLALRLRQDGLL